MSGASETDALLVKRIRSGDPQAWNELIARYEGRLLAFVESRLGRRAPSEDIVQEAFIGFLNSLPNFDGGRPLEGYLFSICSHKLTDYLRREGRRPALPLSSAADTIGGQWQLPGKRRVASSIARSAERRNLEEHALVVTRRDQVARWRKRAEFVKIQCAELLFVRGRSNKDVAAELRLSEQQVANYKFDFLARLRSANRRQGLNEDVFPELHE